MKEIIKMYNGFKPDEAHKDDKQSTAWCEEANKWADMYLNYNDDNESHMLDAFYNNGLGNATVERLKEKKTQLQRRNQANA